MLFIVAFLHLLHASRRHSLDYVGFVTLGLGFCAVLLATSWGGTQYPWISWQVISVCIAAAALLTGFIINENYVEEPVLPLGLWKHSVFTPSNVSNMAVAMAMYGAVFFIPVYAQGVIAVSVTNSGALLIPLLSSAIVVSILVGRLITRTGRYKEFVLAGLIVMGARYYLLTRLGYGSPQTELTAAMVVLGLLDAALPVDRGSGGGQRGAGSHAAIVAREYGIPAVMATIDGTHKLSDGQQVRIDGDQGLVSCVAPRTTRYEVQEQLG